MFIMTGRMIQQQREEDRKTEEERQRDEEWSFDECRRRGCLPTGEPLDALFDMGY